MKHARSTQTHQQPQTTTWPIRGSFKSILSLVMLAVLICLSIASTAHAVTTISQGFLTKDKLSIGSIVSLEDNSSDHVSAVTSKNSDSIYGVVISEGNSLLSLSNGKDDQVQVATGGIVQILVSDLNGKISQGDQITASSIKGVGMKATNNVKVIGIAQGEPRMSKDSKQTYKDDSGKEQTVTIGEVPALISVAYHYNEPEKTVVPTAIQSVANAMAGKKVDSLPIIISSGIFIVTIIAVMSIIYSMIRSSIISVGRNPMSQSAVYRNMVQMSVVVLGILAASFLSIYMILTKL